ncbi:MAG: hypothetical protein AAGE52_04070 [Myxococcota bacterium]
MKKLALMMALSASALSGCVVTSGSETYEACDFTSDCNEFGDFCSPISAEWPDGLIVNDAICTFGCIDSSDCPVSLNGNPGLCVDFSGQFLCYETCVGDFDCDPGFSCGDFGFFENVCFPR